MKIKKKKKILPSQGSFSWTEGNEMHTIMPGEAPSEAQLEEMTREYQRQIRNSPLFEMMIKEYGKEKAEELLKECRMKLER
ncbi:MAG: hypothetical protein M1480_13230 [Bacteroidetes bacterium]|nr:hypothetical protein [Bacteroidota bacterium]MCL5029969.1 hypothetical protein [Bacteroidota bacterium]